MYYFLNKTINLYDLLILLDIKINTNDDWCKLQLHNCNISSISSQDANIDGSLSFTNTYQRDEKKSFFLVPWSFEYIETLNITYIPVDNPRLVFIQILDYLVREVGFLPLHNETYIHPSVQIGSNVVIEEGCIIGEGSVIEHNVVIHSGTKIGKYTRVKANSSIGGDGFGFERLPDTKPIRFPHLGGVIIGNHVEIGSNTCITKGSLGDTIIKDYVKIDNLVHIAHNCIIEEGVFVIACAELSGGVVIHKNSWIGPNASILQKVTLGKNSLVGIGSVVTKNISDDSVCVGNPARIVKSNRGD